MSVVGDESAQVVMQAATKGVEISADILKELLKWLIGLRGRHIENTLKSQQIKMTKNYNAVMEAQMAIQEGRGLISAQKLYRSGEPMVAGTIALDKQQQIEFAKLAKTYGLTYSLIKNDYDPTGKKLLVFAKKDLQKVKDITDRMTENAQIREINKRIDELKEKGVENFTAQDYKDLANLEDLRDSKIAAPINALNKAGDEDIFAKVSGDLKSDGTITFERALNHLTERDYSSKEPYYLAERTNPTKYIELMSTRDVFNKEAYTKTYYNVFNRNEKLGEWNDGRFTGRSRDYWFGLKEKMKAAGGFTDDVVIFKSKAEFDQYVQYYRDSLMRSLNQNLSVALTEHRVAFDVTTGQLTDIQTGMPVIELLSKVNTLDDSERLRLYEALVIAEQVKINRNLELLQNEAARINYMMRTAPEGTPAHSELLKQMEQVDQAEKNYQKLAEQKAVLRGQLSGVDAMQRLRESEKVPDYVKTMYAGREDDNSIIDYKINDLHNADWRTAMQKSQTAKPERQESQAGRAKQDKQSGQPSQGGQTKQTSRESQAGKAKYHKDRD